MRVLLSVGFVCLIQSCDEQTAFSHYHSLSSHGWLASDTIRIDVDTIRMDAQYQVNLGIRTSSAHAYPYQNLTLVVEQQWTTDASSSRPLTSLSKDTLQIAIITPSGDIVGEGVSSYQYIVPFPSLHLYPGVKGTFKVYHLMRKRQLSGITNVGIEIIPL